MLLATAKELATGLLNEIAPFCLKAEIAGSIRRSKAEVKDVELCVIPKWNDGPVKDLFTQEREKVNALYEHLKEHPMIEWIKPGEKEVIPWKIQPEGKYWRGLLLDKIKLDLFLASEINWGIIFLIRTGPAAWSRMFVTQKAKGGWMPNDYKVEDGHLKKITGEIIPTKEEEDVFKICRCKFKPPQERQENPF